MCARKPSKNITVRAERSKVDLHAFMEQQWASICKQICHLRLSLWPVALARHHRSAITTAAEQATMARVQGNYRQSRAASDLCRKQKNREIETTTREVKHLSYQHEWRTRDPVLAVQQRTHGVRRTTASVVQVGSNTRGASNSNTLAQRGPARPCCRHTTVVLVPHKADRQPCLICCHLLVTCHA